MRSIKLLIVVMVLSGLCACSQTGAGSDTSQEPAVSKEDPSLAEAGEKIRRHYQELGYEEVYLPSTLEELCTRLDIDEELYHLACTDVDGAAPELQEEILKARREIVDMADGWYLDDGGIYAVWYDSIEQKWGEFPSFSELFPGWDVPVDFMG